MPSKHTKDGDLEAAPCLGPISRVRAHVYCYLAPHAFHSVHIFAFNMLPQQFYLHAQLRLPLLYFSCVSRMFQDAAVSRPELQRIIDTCEAAGTDSGRYRTTGAILSFLEDWVPPNVSPSLARFKLSWESFVASLVREWKTLNVLSALLLS